MSSNLSDHINQDAMSHPKLTPRQFIMEARKHASEKTEHVGHRWHLLLQLFMLIVLLASAGVGYEFHVNELYAVAGCTGIVMLGSYFHARLFSGYYAIYCREWERAENERLRAEKERLRAEAQIAEIERLKAEHAKQIEVAKTCDPARNVFRRKVEQYIAELENVASGAARGETIMADAVSAVVLQANHTIQRYLPEYTDFMVKPRPEISGQGCLAPKIAEEHCRYWIAKLQDVLTVVS